MRKEKIRGDNWERTVTEAKKGQEFKELVG